jgi:hypothetical protein
MVGSRATAPDRPGKSPAENAVIVPTLSPGAYQVLVVGFDGQDAASQ